MSNKIQNERIKLLSTFFNNLGVASIVAGIFAPLFAAQSPPYNLAYFHTIPVGYVIGVGLVALGLWNLGWLSEE